MSKNPMQRILAKADDPNASEDAIQAAFFAKLVGHPDPRVRWVHSVPNGGQRDAMHAAQMVATGVRSGVWDVCFPFWSDRCPFGYIEFKIPKHRTSKDGGLSANQVEFRDFITAQGAFIRVCYSYNEGLIALDDYLNGRTR